MAYVLGLLLIVAVGLLRRVIVRGGVSLIGKLIGSMFSKDNTINKPVESETAVFAMLGAFAAIVIGLAIYVRYFL